MSDTLLLEFQAALAGRYALERELGRGGMGIVFRARDLRLDRVVAIKLLPKERARSRERFLREARIAARLSHPHIIPIHAVEEAGEFVFFVMSYVDGETLGARVRREGPLKSHDAARVLREVAWALAYAHGQGVIHRDVKPENILLERDSGRALVADFGIARLFAAGASVTGEQELVGTPEYMSPEQALAGVGGAGGAGGSIDGRSDLYSLGIVGYYMLSGRLPFTASTIPALIVQQVQKAPPPLDAPGAPHALRMAIERCMAKDPALRFQNGEALAAVLAETLERRRELPVPLRAFLSASRSGLGEHYLGPLLVSAALIPAGLTLLMNAVFAGHPPALFRGGVLGIAVVLIGAALSTPLVLAARRVRRLLRTGYRREDLIQGLELEVARRREEEEFTAAGAPSWERLMRGKMYGALALAGLAGVASFIVPYPAVLVAFGLFGLGSAAAVATGLAAWAASRGRFGGAERRQRRFWKGAIGRWLFRIAGVGLGRGVEAASTPDRPTEMALGLAAIELFEQLPRPARQQLEQLPDVVRALEQRVQRLRQDGRATEVDGALGALETIRLDLLRLHGGLGTVDGLTADLGAAREIGEQVDALLAAEQLKAAD